jgi:hypothetical protein
MEVLAVKFQGGRSRETPYSAEQSQADPRCPRAQLEMKQGGAEELWQVRNEATCQ